MSDWRPRLIASDIHQGVFLADYVLGLRPRPRIAVVYVNDDYGRALRSVLIERLRTAGISSLNDAAYAEGDELTDMRVLVSTLVAVRPSLLIWIGRAREYAMIASELTTALQPLQRQVEGGWDLAKSSLIAPNYEIIGRQFGPDFLAAVNVSLDTGRVRIALGPLIPELSGRSILLAPARDRDERIRWICVPIDIPVRFLPHECKEV